MAENKQGLARAARLMYDLSRYCKSHTGCEGCPLTDDKGCKLMPRSDIPWVNVNIVFWCVKRADVEWLEAVIVDG